MNYNAFRLLAFFLRFFLISIILVTWTPKPEEFHEIPPLVPVRDIKQKKRNFLEYMKPIVKRENDRIRKQREQLHTLHKTYLKNGGLDDEQQERFNRLCQYYKIKHGDPGVVDVWLILFKRVDIVPLELALAQSASESAWGTSRFARLGNSFFGQWTYTETRGIKPLDKAVEKKHRVARFNTVPESVRSYMRNLNTHWAYQSFRQMRYNQRQRNEKLDGLRLADGLEMYSERRKRYVDEIKNLIKSNRRLMQRF